MGICHTIPEPQEHGKNGKGALGLGSYQQRYKLRSKAVRGRGRFAGPPNARGKGIEFCVEIKVDSQPKQGVISCGSKTLSMPPRP